MLKVVNMIPNSWSDEQNQDCEPNLSVNPANSLEIIGTAFTFDNPAGTSAVSPAMTGNWAPIFSSVDGGNTWALQFVLPSAAGDQLPTWDVTSRYGGTSGEVYSGLISPGGFTILIGRAPDAATQHTTIASVTGDQPFLEATTTVAGGISRDRLYVGYNANGTDSTVNVFLDALAAAPATTATALDVRFPADMPPTRTAIHHSGTIYCAFYSYNGAGPSALRDVVVVKDLDWGASAPAFQALVDGGDGQVGVRVATGISNPWYNSNFEDPSFGNDRYGPELTIAVDPSDADRVYITYMTGTTAADALLHLRRSDDGGQTWSSDLRTVPTAKSPSLAVNAWGRVGLVYQQVVGANWMTVLEVSHDRFAASFETHVLAITPTNTPTPASIMATYLGDYIKLASVGEDFYGIFSAGNEPVEAHFPSGVTYQRNVNWTTQTLLGNDGVTPVPASIDPFFFKLSFGVPKVTTAIADRGAFGECCVGSFKDETLTINNSGTGLLRITRITSSTADIEAPSVLSYPIKLEVGDSIDVPIRFEPRSVGSKIATIRIDSNDPASPHRVDVSGVAPEPRLSLVMANRGGFGKVCVGHFADEPLILNNSGRCPVTVTGIASSSVAFEVPEVLSFPLLIGSGDALDLPIRFAPTTVGAAAGTITITSSDPASPHTVHVTGTAPAGRLVVTGSLCFGGVKACCRAERTVSICNMGECALQVSSVAFKRKNPHWKLINNPFPATLPPGACLGLVIRYKATEKCPIACELVITSDDPATPVKTLDVMAYTIWDACHCKRDCDKCNGRGCDCCRCGDCEGAADDCCADEDEDED
ncbi:MAG TPA: choice-of-anchor D domain-containing protein [Solirubrobacteraceae bacterium]|nr:choice-of-anchor D domain-containing protein [Solirubrobacteraceae bacterium]